LRTAIRTFIYSAPFVAVTSFDSFMKSTALMIAMKTILVLLAFQQSMPCYFNDLHSTLNHLLLILGLKAFERTTLTFLVFWKSFLPAT